MSSDEYEPLLHELITNEDQNTVNCGIPVGMERKQQDKGSTILSSDTECEAGLNCIQQLPLGTQYSSNTNSNLSLPKGKDAHFFVSYCNDDRSIVHPIVDELEQTHRVHCILDERDFTPGMEIHTNIEKCMERSMKVLLFLSAKFLQSSYCKYENNLAFVMSITTGKNIIIPIKLDECEIPNTLKTLTYIDVNTDKLTKRIVDAYTSTETDFLPVDFWPASKMENGYSIVLPCQTESVCCLRPRRCKIVLTDKTTHALNVGNFQVSEKTVQDAADIANSYTSSNVWTRSNVTVRCCIWLCTSVLIILALCMIWGIIVIIVNDRHFSQKSADAQIKFLIAFLTVSIAGSILTCTGMCVYYDRKLKADTRRIDDDIFEKITCKTYRKGVMFKVDDDESGPLITIIRYNIRPCQTYLARKLKEYKEENYGVTHASMDVYEDQADIYIRQFLREYMCKRWPDAPVNRHNVKGGQSCICQILESRVGEYIQSWRF